MVQPGQQVELLRTVWSSRLQAALDGVFDPAHTELRIRYADVYEHEWEYVGGTVTGL